MIPEEHLTMILTEEETFLEDLIRDYHCKSTQTSFQTESGCSLEFQNWLLRSGMVPESHLAQNRIGLYTDFT